MKKYQIIYADPPWRYNNPKGNDPSMGGVTYQTMADKDICDLPVEKIADKNSVLFLWATMPKLQEALDVMKAWGFKYTTTTFVWIKTNIKSGGIYSGLGHWSNGNSEIVLFGKKGHPKRNKKNIKQIVISPVTKHSKKPFEVKKRIVELMGDLPRIELFARGNKDKDLFGKNTFDGWDCLGNNINGKDIRQELEEMIGE